MHAHQRPFAPLRAPRRTQRGAVLYVALIMLVLLALIGIAGMQVSGLQEKMSANYYRGNVAFQNAEAEARSSEAQVESSIYATGTFSADQEMCSPTFDPLTWAEGAADTEANHVRRVDKCFPASSVRVGGKVSEETGNIYEISALASDSGEAASASAVINTIFIP